MDNNISPIRDDVTLADPQEEQEHTGVTQEPYEHVHTWQATVSQTHTALLWCTACGPASTVACTLAGDPNDLQWHTVKDVEARG